MSSRLRQLLHRAAPGADSVGDGLLRIRNASIALLGLVTAIGVGLVIFISQQGWPGVFNAPIPAAPELGVVHNDSIALTQAGLPALSQNAQAATRGSVGGRSNTPPGPTGHRASGPGASDHLGGAAPLGGDAPAPKGPHVTPAPESTSAPAPAPTPVVPAPAPPPVATPAPAPAPASGDSSKPVAAVPAGVTSGAEADEGDSKPGDGHSKGYSSEKSADTGKSTEYSPPKSSGHGRSKEYSSGKSPEYSSPHSGDYGSPQSSAPAPPPPAEKAEAGYGHDGGRYDGKSGKGYH